MFGLRVYSYSNQYLPRSTGYGWWMALNVLLIQKPDVSLGFSPTTTTISNASPNKGSRSKTRSIMKKQWPWAEMAPYSPVLSARIPVSVSLSSQKPPNLQVICPMTLSKRGHCCRLCGRQGWSVLEGFGYYGKTRLERPRSGVEMAQIPTPWKSYRFLITYRHTKWLVYNGLPSVRQGGVSNR